MGVGGVNVLKEIREFLTELILNKVFWVAIVLLVILLAASPNQYKGTVVSRGIVGAKVDMTKQLQPLNTMLKDYQDKTGTKITANVLSSPDLVARGKENMSLYQGLSGNEVYTRFLYKPYTLQGQVIMKIKMDTGADYLEITSGGSVYGVYFMDTLPPQVKGETIELTGIVTGYVVSGKTTETTLVSTYKNVSSISLSRP